MIIPGFELIIPQNQGKAVQDRGLTPKARQTRLSSEQVGIYDGIPGHCGGGKSEKSSPIMDIMSTLAKKLREKASCGNRPGRRRLDQEAKIQNPKRGEMDRDRNAIFRQQSIPSCGRHPLASIHALAHVLWRRFAGIQKPGDRSPIPPAFICPSQIFFKLFALWILPRLFILRGSG